MEEKINKRISKLEGEIKEIEGDRARWGYSWSSGNFIHFAKEIACKRAQIELLREILTWI